VEAPPPLLLDDVDGPRRPRSHPRWRRTPWGPLRRRVHRRPARWWLSLALAAACGAAATWAVTGPPPRDDEERPAPATPAAGPERAGVPDGLAALAVPIDDRSLRLAVGDRVDLLATDLGSGRATIVARGALVLEVSDTVAAVAVDRDDLPRAAAGASQGLLTPALVERG